MSSDCVRWAPNLELNGILLPTSFTIIRISELPLHPHSESFCTSSFESTTVRPIPASMANKISSLFLHGFAKIISGLLTLFFTICISFDEAQSNPTPTEESASIRLVSGLHFTA
jgi:hypothetical protein